MPQVTLDYTKSVYENASMYFDQAKKAKHKIAGAQEAVAKAQKELASLTKKRNVILHEIAQKKPPRTKEWFEKFRWCKTPSGLLAIGGRDTTTNEIILKKHVAAHDKIFHTQMPGSPFFVLQTQKKTPTPQDILMVATLCAVYSKAWPNQLSSLEVFMVNPDQVSKTPNSGEYLSKGQFVIRGKKEIMQVSLELTLGVENYNDGTSDNLRLIAGTEYVKSISQKPALTIKLGTQRPSELAKVIAKHFDVTDLDEIIRMLPSGPCRIGK
jgi:predicted ribosome quality control (RQC) complex YloA/Tae2 family protein